MLISLRQRLTFVVWLSLSRGCAFVADHYRVGTCLSAWLSRRYPRCKVKHYWSYICWRVQSHLRRLVEIIEDFSVTWMFNTAQHCYTGMPTTTAFSTKNLVLYKCLTQKTTCNHIYLPANNHWGLLSFHIEPCWGTVLCTDWPKWCRPSSAA